MEAYKNIAIVTGASSGIGREFALQLVKNRRALQIKNQRPIDHLPQFDEIWLLARRAERLQELKQDLLNIDTTIAIRLFALDLTDSDSINTVAQEFCNEPSLRLSVLINNAGYGCYGPLLEVDSDWQLGQIDLNCRSLTQACALLGKYLFNGSLVINVASLAAFAPLAGFAVYAASKAYVLSLSAALAAEWEGQGIKVHAFCPGSVQSEFALVASGGLRKEVAGGLAADKMVRRALKQAGRGRWISVPHLNWQLNRFASWLFGRKISARFAWRHLRRPHAKKD